MSGRGKLPNGLMRILPIGRLFGKKTQGEVNSNFEKCLLTDNLTAESPLEITYSKFGHANISIDISDDDDGGSGGVDWCAAMPDLEGTMVCHSDGSGTVTIPAMSVQVGPCESVYGEKS